MLFGYLPVISFAFPGMNKDGFRHTYGFDTSKLISTPSTLSNQK